MLFRTIFFATCLFAAPAAAQEASFDCKKAATAVEKAICQGLHTAALDRAMDELYRAALAKAGTERAATETAQRKWLAERNSACGRAKPDIGCLEKLYKQRIVALARLARGASGAFISGSYDYRQKGEGGDLFLAEMPDGTTLVLIETVNVGHQSPHTCTFMQRIRDRRGDVLSYRGDEASKRCGLEIAVTGDRAVIRETPKECYELAQYYCGAHGYMLGDYVRR